MSWRGLDHRTIYAMVVDGGQGAGVSDAAQQAWANAQRVISDAEHTIAAAVRAGEAEWEGGGGDAMRTAYTPLGAWALDAAVSAHVTATGVRDQADLAENTRRHAVEHAPAPNYLVEKGAEIITWDGHSVFDDRAEAVDRLMTDYEAASRRNEARFDGWSVPPTVVAFSAHSASASPCLRRPPHRRP